MGAAAEVLTCHSTCVCPSWMPETWVSSEPGASLWNLKGLHEGEVLKKPATGAKSAKDGAKVL